MARDGQVPVVVIGAGLTGMAAARVLGRHCIVLERESEPGGLARTRTKDGFSFDFTGHWLHLRDERTQRLAAALPGVDWLTVERRSEAFSYGVRTPYPFQVHLHGHDPRLVHECLVGLWRARTSRHGRIRTFQDFLDAHFGEGLVRYFLEPYNEKLWGVAPSELTAEWCQRFVPVPTVEEVLAGALGVSTGRVGYNARFRYPKRGGIQAFANALFATLPDGVVRLGETVQAVDHKKKKVLVSNGWISYEALVSTMPLPELCARLVAPPPTVREAAEALRSSAVVFLDVAAKVATKAHWIYVPERKYPFYRVGVYSNVAPSMAPKGSASLYVELSDRRDAARPPATVYRKVAKALERIGVVREAGDILWMERRIIDPAYVLYDENWAWARRRLLRFLRRHDIYSAGRYGGWVYNSMEDGLLEGLELGEALARRFAGET